MVVWMSARPIHSWTRRMSALAIMRVPKAWRRPVEAEHIFVPPEAQSPNVAICWAFKSRRPDLNRGPLHYE